MCRECRTARHWNIKTGWRETISRLRPAAIAIDKKIKNLVVAVQIESHLAEVSIGAVIGDIACRVKPGTFVNYFIFRAGVIRLHKHKFTWTISHIIRSLSGISFF